MSGLAVFSQSSRFGRRRLTLLMLKVAIFMLAVSRSAVLSALARSFSQPNTERPSERR